MPNIVRPEPLRPGCVELATKPSNSPTIVIQGQHLEITPNMYDKCVRHMPEVFGYQGRARFAALAIARREQVTLSAANACLEGQNSESSEEDDACGSHTTPIVLTSDESRQTASSSIGSHTEEDSGSFEFSATSRSDSRTGHHAVELKIRSPRRSHKKKKSLPQPRCRVILDSTCLSELFSNLREIFHFTMLKNIVRGVKKTFIAEAPVKSDGGSVPEFRIDRPRPDDLFEWDSDPENDPVIVPGRLYSRFEALARQSQYADACVTLVEGIRDAPFAETEDLPERDAPWSRINHCALSTQTARSSAYELFDWQFHSSHDGLPSPGFMKNLKAFLKSAATCVLVEKRMGDFAEVLKIDSELIRRDVSSNPYVIYAMENGDEAFGDFVGNEALFKDIYVVREYLGFSLEGAYHERLRGFVGEGGVGSNVDVEGFIEEEQVQAPGRSFKKIIESLVDRFWAMLKGVASMVSKAYDGFLESLRRFLVRTLVRFFKLDELAVHMQTAKFKAQFAVVVSVSVISFLMGSYILGRAFGQGLITTISKVPASGNRFVAEAELSPAALISSALIAIYGLRSRDADSLKKKSMYMMSLVAGGTLVANLGACCFSLMPQLFQDAVMYKFGSEDQRLKREVDEWRSVANALIQFSKIAKVVISDYYIERVVDTMKKGSDLQTKLYAGKYSGMRNIVVATFVRLQKIQYHVNSHKNAGTKRPEPFCMHLAGAAGVGKTLIADRLVRESCDVATVYPRNGNEEHWNGYACHDAAILDEWLVGPTDKAEREAGEFLTLVSSSKSTLPMATLDDPFVGIKGAHFESRVVVTINNTLHNRVAGFDSTALQRRRDVVIEVQFHPDYQRFVVDDKIQLALLPPEDVRSVAWAKFRLVRPIYSMDWESTATPWCSYQLLVQAIREKYNQKVEFQEVLRNSDMDIGDTTTSVDELINQELRQSCSLPKEPPTVMEAIGQILGGFVAEAPASPMRHVHVCPCGARGVRHTRGQEFTCTACKIISPCDDNGPEPSSADRTNFATAIGDCGEGAHYHACVMNNCPAKLSCIGGNSRVIYCPAHGAVDSETGVVSHTVTEVPPRVPPPEVFTSYDAWCASVFSCVYDSLGSSWDLQIGEVYREVDYELGGHMKRLFMIGAVTGAMIAIAKWFSGDKEIEEITYTGQSDRTDHKSHRGKRVTKGAWGRHTSIEAEASKCVETVDLDLGHIIVKAIPLRGRWLMTYAHGLYDGGTIIPEGRTLRLSYKKHMYEWKLVPDHIVLCRDPTTGVLIRDLAFIHFACPQLPQFKNSVNLFATDDEIPEVRCRVSLKSRDRLIFTEARPEVNVYSYEGMQMELTDGFMYQAQTAAGDCGTPVLLAQGPHITKCIGIHVAGTVTKDFPFGLATRVSREMIEEVFDLCPESYVAEAPEFLDRLAETECPNLQEVRTLRKNERVHLTAKTKLKASAIAEHLPWATEKAPAIMSKSDPRSQGLDPVEEAIATLAHAPKVRVDQGVLSEASDELYEELKEGLDFGLTGGIRELTFEEALFGIPGALSGVVTSTHPGYPYCHFVDRPGKKSLIWYDEGEGRYTKDFRDYCERQLVRVRAGEDIDKVFVGFMKDEVRSRTKISKVATRITYSNDVSYNVVCRMLFGSLVIAFNHSFPQHGYALGINPSSYDAGKIYHRLRTFSDRLVAGDFGEYDLRHQRQIMDESFSVLERLGNVLPGADVTFEHVRKHETTVPLHVGDYAIRTVANNASGGFWTTILNCIVADLYFRYTWKLRHPTKRFSDFVRAVILGDDHILSVHKMVEWNPLMIREDMKAVGQLYTSAWKDKELDDKYLTFSEVMFLGNYFRVVDGHWSGALRKETLRESLMWTRNNNLTIFQECVQMVEYASQWDKEFFTEYRDNVDCALGRIGFPPTQLAPWLSLRKMVANRTADSNADFRFVAQAGDLTKIDASTEVPLANPVVGFGRTLQERSVNDSPADLSKGTDSLIMRAQLDWSTSDGLGSILYSKGLPFEMLGQGDQQNLQNMSFQNFLYSEPDIEVTVQINGSPTHAGVLCLFMAPLINVVPGHYTWPSLTHVMINPNVNTTASVVLPFKYWRSMLDNQDSHYNPMSVAWVKLGVYSPLVTKTLPSTCGVVIFSRFKTRVFIPRQLAPAPTNTRPIYGFTAGTGAKLGNIYTSDTTFVAQGNISSTNVTNSYTIGDVAGSVPNETTMEVGGQGMEGQLTVPMDNPPMVGGGIPTVAQFPSMSRSNGPVPTTGMSLHPLEMSRQAMLTRDPRESNLAHLAALNNRFDNQSWSTTMPDGALIAQYSLGSWVVNNSVNDGPTSLNQANYVPFNVWLINEFKFARYDVVFTFTAVRTKFHSGRLMGSVYYGITPSTNSSVASVYNTVMDFNGDNMVQEMRIPYNNTQEYIRTNDNSAPTQSYRPGSLRLTVLNELRTASEIVANSIDVIVTVRFENLRVAVPNPYSTMSMGSQSRMTFVAQAGTPRGKGAEIGEDPDEVTTGGAKGANTPQLPCRVVLGEKFEYNITDVHEIIRRYVPLSPSAYQTSFTVTNGASSYKAWRIPVYLTSQWANVYAAWSGTIKFRIFVYDATPAMVMHIPTNRTSNGTAYSDVDMSGILFGGETSFQPSGNLKVTSGYWPTYAAREMTMPLSATSSWIDVSVPFCSELNYLPNQDRGLSNPQIGPYGNGYIWVRTSLTATMDVFQAAGDDFRYHGYLPAPGIARRPAIYNGAVVENKNFAFAGVFPN